MRGHCAGVLYYSSFALHATPSLLIEDLIDATHPALASIEDGTILHSKYIGKLARGLVLGYLYSQIVISAHTSSDWRSRRHVRSSSRHHHIQECQCLNMVSRLRRIGTSYTIQLL